MIIKVIGFLKQADTTPWPRASITCTLLRSLLLGNANVAPYSQRTFKSDEDGYVSFKLYQDTEYRIKLPNGEEYTVVTPEIEEVGLDDLISKYIISVNYSGSSIKGGISIMSRVNVNVGMVLLDGAGTYTKSSFVDGSNLLRSISFYCKAGKPKVIWDRGEERVIPVGALRGVEKNFFNDYLWDFTLTLVDGDKVEVFWSEEVS